MNGTETKLWRRLNAACDPEEGEYFTRIETRTVDGVSDVTYITPQRSGWIELKTSSSRPTAPFTLHSPLTLPQASWLLRHHAPKRGLWCWVLVGMTGKGAAGWREFVLLPPAAAAGIFIRDRAPTLMEATARAGVIVQPSMSVLMDFIKGKRKKE